MVYESSKIYKEITKAYREKKIVPKSFAINDQVLIFSLRLKLFPGRLRSRWPGPLKIKEVKPYGIMVLWDKQGGEYTVNEDRLNPYLVDTDIAEGDTIFLVDPPNA